MHVDQLNEAYAMPGILAFDERAGLARAHVTLPGCTATVYLHGAHVTAWQPTGTRPVLFLSEQSAYAEDKAIRGGIPICFPWFGDRGDGVQTAVKSPAHGFARVQQWEFVSALLLPGESETLRLVLRLGPSELSRVLGFDHFMAVYELIFGEQDGRAFTARLTVLNAGRQPMRFEEALHTYLAVADVRSTPVTGLEGATYLDKTDGYKPKQTPPGPLTLSGTTDRVFPGNPSPTAVHDAERTLRTVKQDSASTIVWNPWAEGSASLKDLAPDAWPGFLCVESANVGADAVTLAPGQGHTLAMTLSVAG